ncbi:hypothetical protein CDAR_282671 [Caerostris darwini]|uniref:Uncharacterized protein n=1 Tax=Caerostris darwini TaxID=1538125 RepID=A0AAV4T9Q4_9ARAC|nr:hypothetical protein CDAR_282671 [Caerostris darwini]
MLLMPESRYGQMDRECFKTSACFERKTVIADSAHHQTFSVLELSSTHEVKDTGEPCDSASSFAGQRPSMSIFNSCDQAMLLRPESRYGQMDRECFKTSACFERKTVIADSAHHQTFSVLVLSSTHEVKDTGEPCDSASSFAGQRPSMSIFNSCDQAMLLRPESRYGQIDRECFKTCACFERKIVIAQHRVNLFQCFNTRTERYTGEPCISRRSFSGERQTASNFYNCDQVMLVVMESRNGHGEN